MKMERLSIGEVYGDLTVVGPPTPKESKAGKRENYYLCHCSCGESKVVRGASLKRGTTKSCGCLTRRLAKEKCTTHGMSKTKVYSVWLNMRRRCYEPSNNRYKSYGAKGIRVCDRWLDFNLFFLDVGDLPFEGATLDRISPLGDYEPSNVRWASQKQQQRNRANNRKFTYGGESLTSSEWAERLGVGPKTMATRLLGRGWSIERALHQPIRSGGNRRQNAKN